MRRLIHDDDMDARTHLNNAKYANVWGGTTNLDVVISVPLIIVQGYRRAAVELRRTSALEGSEGKHGRNLGQLLFHLMP